MLWCVRSWLRHLLTVSWGLHLVLAFVVTPHRNRPVAPATVVSPQPADLAASASDWRRLVDAPSPFGFSGPSQMKPEKLARSVHNHTPHRMGTRNKHTRKTAAGQAQGLRVPSRTLPCPASPSWTETETTGTDFGSRDRDRNRQSVLAPFGTRCRVRSHSALFKPRFAISHSSQSGG